MTNPRTQRARDLRQAASMPEKIIWNAIKNRKAGGLKFRRQVPFGPYVVDFYCAESKVAIEIDGRAHDDRGEHDRRRSEYLRAQGIRVYRFAAPDISRDAEDVIRKIADAARRAPSPG